MVAQTSQTIDVHAHILTEETIRLLQSEAPKVAPKLSDVDDQFGTLDVAGSVYRHFPRGGWDLERRLQDMAASKVDVQVLSVCPQTFVYALAGSGVEVGGGLRLAFAVVFFVVSGAIGIWLYRRYRHGKSLGEDVEKSI